MNFDCDWAEQFLVLARGLQGLYGFWIPVTGLFLYFVWPRVAHGLAEIKHGVHG